MSIYVTYLTTYRGNKLPPFYIGSSTLLKINNGYCGSVKSKKYKHIWNDELKHNPHLFKTTIISYHNTRLESLEKEYYLQTNLGVIKSPLYTNMSIAAPNGYFGMDVSGNNNPNYGKRHTWNNHLKQIHSDKMKGMGNGFYGKTHNIKSKQTIGDKNANNTYIAYDPNGNTYTVNNLKRFCKEHNLTPAGMFATAKGTYPKHKGWYCKKI